MEDGNNRLFRMYVGTYAGGDEESIFFFHLFPHTGRMKLVRGFNGGENPSYFATDSTARKLVAVNETEHFKGTETGSVSFFFIEEVSGFLNFRNRVSSQGSLPVSVTLANNEEHVIVANYNSGNVAVFSFKSNGDIASASDTFQHHGSGSDQERQTSPHAHQAVESPDGKFIFVVDLGLDQIRSYHLKAEKLIAAHNPVAYSAPSGWGPRQLVFHPDGKYAYLVHELKSMVSALSYDVENGSFHEVHSLPCIPEGYNEKNKCGGIAITADGRFLYVSNRGHNSIAVYALEKDTGQMELIEFKSVEGSWPREFCLSPDGSILIAANQKSGTLTSFSIDKKTGKLHYTGHKVKVIKPVFVMVTQ